MSNNLDIPVLERPAFFNGERLTAADLTAVQAFHRELRWLHNRSLHNWGIAFGFAVSGARGERVVAVQPGYALDCKGRDLILGEAQQVPIPAVGGASGGQPATYYLTATYAEDEDLTPEVRAGTCDTSGAVRRPETPLIRWQRPHDYRRGLDIILATIQVQNCQLAADVSGSERRNAVPAQQPYVAAGETGRGETEWSLWPTPDEEQGIYAVGVTTKVSTASAGFRITPRYQAHVVGDRVLEYPQKIGTEAALQRLTIVVDGYVQIANATASGFDLRVIMPLGVVISTKLTYMNYGILKEEFMGWLQTELKWHVVWLGIEG